MNCNVPSLIKLDLIVFQGSRSLNKLLAGVVFQELGLSCVQSELEPAKTGQDPPPTLQLRALEYLIGALLTSESPTLHSQKRHPMEKLVA